MSDVNSAGFSTTVLPSASAGAIFQASISSGKFHGMIWPQTPTGTIVGELALQQLRPAGVVIEMARRQRDVDVAGLADRLAVVHRLEHGEEAAHGAGSCGRAHRDGAPARGRRASPSGLRLARRRRPRASTSAALPCAMLRQHLAGRRIDACRRAADFGVDEFAVDEMAEAGVVALRARRAPRLGFRAPGRSPSSSKYLGDAHVDHPSRA